MIKLKNLIEAQVGQVDSDPSTGIKTTLTSMDPETGKMSWDVQYDLDPRVLYKKLNDVLEYLEDAPKGSEMEQFKVIIKKLKNKALKMSKK